MLMLDEAIARELLTDHSTHPRNEGVAEQFDHAFTLRESATGDVVRLWVSYQYDAITKIFWTAQGSGVLKASCSLMSERLAGTSKTHALEIIEAFTAMLTGAMEKTDWVLLGDAAALAGIRHLPARVKCAVLPWRAMEQLLGE